MVKHYNIPVFLPELACPFRCKYCNQSAISGQAILPADSDINALIERNLHSFSEQEKVVELAFFGGNFTGLPFSVQRSYLALALPYYRSGRIQGIRLSTRPDYITNENLLLLKDFPVTSIELGAQSLDDEVLLQSGRGHKAADVFRSSEMILGHGFRLGLQMMTGLPGDTPAKSMETARSIISAGASETRIYPCLVVAGTELETMYRNGIYSPQPVEEAVSLAADLYQLFRRAGIRVLRMGLHPSEELNAGSYVAGPYHPSFTEMVMTELWSRIFAAENQWPSTTELRLLVPEVQRNHAIGYRAANKHYLLKRFRWVKFIADESLQPFTYRIEQA